MSSKLLVLNSFIHESTSSFPLFLHRSVLVKGFVDKLVLIDIPESSTKGGTMDLEIFSLPKVEVSKGIHLFPACNHTKGWKCLCFACCNQVKEN